MDKERIAKELAGIVGADGLVTDPGELRVYETDGLTVFKAMPRAGPFRSRQGF